MPQPQETPSHSNSELLTLLEEIDDAGEDLSEWEVSFVSDLIDRQVKIFTERQAAVIRRIHEERLNES